VSEQISFFSADAAVPSYAHVEGLLAGPGQWVRRDDAARVSVVVNEVWRVDVLTALFAEIGWQAEAVTAEGDLPAVRSEFRTELLPLAEAWTRGAVKHAPPGFLLDGPRLRWWAVAAGRIDPLGYVFGLGPSDEHAWAAIGAALAHAGLPAAFIGPRADGPAYRIVGARRTARLLELLGSPPEGVPDSAWPARPVHAHR
jgi:hypothetical protein